MLSKVASRPACSRGGPNPMGSRGLALAHEGGFGQLGLCRPNQHAPLTARANTGNSCSSSSSRSSLAATTTSRINERSPGSKSLNSSARMPTRIPTQPSHSVAQSPRSPYQPAPQQQPRMPTSSAPSSINNSLSSSSQADNLPPSPSSSNRDSISYPAIRSPIPEQEERLQDIAYLATLEEFRGVLSQDTLTELESTLPQEEQGLLTQVLTDLQFLDAYYPGAAQTILDGLENSSGSSSSSSTGGSRISSSTSSTSEWMSGGEDAMTSARDVRGVEMSSDAGGPLSLEDIHARQSRQINAIRHRSDFISYLRGVFSSLDDEAFELVLDSFGDDVQLIESLYNDIYSLESCPEDAVPQKYLELSAQMENLIEQFASRPAPTLAEVLSSGSRSYSSDKSNSNSSNDNNSSSMSSSSGGSLETQSSSMWPAQQPSQHSSPSTSASDATPPSPATIDMGFVVTGVHAASIQQPVATPKPSGKATKVWGAAVRRGRPPKTRGAVFPRDPSPQAEKLDDVAAE